MFYLLLFGLFLLQEPVSSNVALLEAYQLHYNLWLVHGLFAAATVIDLSIGYALGQWLLAHFLHTRFVQRLKDRAEQFAADTGRYGTYFFLFLLAPSLFPYSAIIPPWLGISFRKSLLCIFLGNLVLWYGAEWLVVLGVKSLIPDTRLALYAVILISVLIAFFLRLIKTSRN